jgi:hypothetical protein
MLNSTRLRITALKGQSQEMINNIHEFVKRMHKEKLLKHITKVQQMTILRPEIILNVLVQKQWGS